MLSTIMALSQARGYASKLQLAVFVACRQSDATFGSELQCTASQDTSEVLHTVYTVFIFDTVCRCVIAQMHIGEGGDCAIHHEDKQRNPSQQ